MVSDHREAFMLILITAGTGFIGVHLADDCLVRGHRVWALEEPATQVHGEGQVAS